MLIIKKDVISSTNKYIKEHYETLDNYTIVAANYQTNGRGRMTRVWHSTAGENILMSILIKEFNNQSDLNLLSLVTGVAVHKFLSKYLNNLYIKWPNDVLVDNKKICGILLEGKMNNNSKMVVIGIGININQTNFDDEINLLTTSLKKELKRIDDVLQENERFQKFIADVGLVIALPNGDTMTVTEDNIIGLRDSINYLITKKKIISSEFNKLTTDIDKLEREKRIEEQQLDFFEDSSNAIEIFEKQIARIPINAVVLEKKIKNTENEIKKLNQRIKELTRFKDGHSTITSLYNNAKKYLIELGLDGKSLTEKYLFTSNLKELSGAILHNTVFSFRISCLLEIEKYLNIKLPIILDSPSGKEIDSENIRKLINILKRDFSNHQIIIASIYKYELDSINTITINNRLIEMGTTE